MIAVIAFSLATSSPLAMACGTLPAEQQEHVDAAQSKRLRALATEMAAKADSIFIGNVTALDRPSRDPLRPGRVTMSVRDTLKGPEAQTQTLEWVDVFILSCDAADSFGNTGFRPNGAYIVYVKAGQVIRSAAADGLRETSVLNLSDEVSLVAAQHHR